MANKIESTSPRKGILKLFSGSFAIRIIYTAFGFVNSILLARVLGSDGYGIYVFVMSVVALLSVPTQFGMPMVVVRDFASYQIMGKWEAMKGLVIRSHQFVVFVGLVVCAIAAIWVILNPGNYADDKQSSLLLGLVLVPVLSLGALRDAMLRGLRFVILAQFSESIIRPCLFFLGLFSCLLFFSEQVSVVDIVIFYISCSLVAYFFGWFLYIKNEPKEIKNKIEPIFNTREWVSSALPIGMSGAIQMLNMQISIVLLSVYAIDSDMAFYRVAALFSGLIAIVLQVVNSIIAPEISRMYARKSLKGIEFYLGKVNKIIVLATLPIVLGIIIAGKWAIPVLYGESFSQAYLPLLILMLGQTFNALMGPVGLLLNMTGHQSDVTKAMAISLIVNVLLHLLMLPFWGLVGAAIASSTMLVTWNAILWLKVKQRLEIKYYV